MTFPEAQIRTALAEALGTDVQVRNRTSLAGGDINHAARLDTSAGPVFIKWHLQPPPGMFSAEAKGLTALATSATGLVVPRVIAWQDSGAAEPGFLITELLDDSAPPAADFDEALGVGLAELHQTTRSTFGFESDNYIGTTPQPNPSTATWLAFYREHRLGHQTRIARDEGRLSEAEAAACDRLCDRLDEWITEAPPALIHGDLWSGNLLRHCGRPALIDPAAYYGHPEAELGMMTLFGGFSARTFDAYETRAGLDPQWRQRLPLYQLYHLLNHANLFGGGYVGQSMRVVRRYVG